VVSFRHPAIRAFAGSIGSSYYGVARRCGRPRARAPRTRCQQHAQHIGIERGRVALCCLLGYETARPLSRGVIDGNIQATETRDGLIDEATHVVLVTHVGTPILCLSADLAEVSD
jgi:hypothetical protein